MSESGDRDGSNARGRHEDRGIDLDALIGDLQGEAARRRAAPGFPLDEEARLGIELDGQAPQPLAPKLERLAHLTLAVTRMSGDPAAARPGLAGRMARKAVSLEVDPIARAVSSLGGLFADALRTVSARLADLDERLRRLERPDGPRTTATESVDSGGSAVAGWFEAWQDRLQEHLPLPPGRILYAGANAEAAVGTLRAAGIDAYGLNPDADRYQTHPDVRQGDLLEHLGTVGERTLGAVLCVAPGGIGDQAVLDRLTDQLARVAGTVVVLSEAPWWWRARLGPVGSDLSRSRPLTAETWLAGLHHAGFRGAAEYGPAGSSYRVVGHQAGMRPGSARP